MLGGVRYNSDHIDIKDIIQFIGNASNQDCDFEIDRLITIFQFIRENLTEKPWYTIPGMRRFLEENIDKNPYIPRKYFELNKKQSTQNLSGRELFFSECQKYFGTHSMKPFKIDLDDFVNKIKKSETYARRTGQVKLHSVQLFFSKFAEWYISYIYCKKFSFKKIVDIGSSSPQFAQFITELIDDVELKIIDIEYPEGETRVTDQITKIGADAGDLFCFEDESVDYICMHNAIEHFAGDSDTRCIKECKRILKPGGKIVIVPLFTSDMYTVYINPITFFFSSPYKALHDALEDEVKSDDCSFSFNFNILGHFSRLYDWSSFSKRLLQPAGDMNCRFYPVEFSGIYDEASEEYDNPIHGQILRYDIFNKTNFHILEFYK